MADTTIAQTILRQLGGRTFLMMTGAKQPTAGANWLSFRLPGSGGFTRNGINFVRITLEPSDTYKVEFQRIRGFEIKTISEHDDIYAETLCELFRRETGLETRMPRLAHA